MAITLHSTTKHPSTVLMPPEDKYSKPPLRDEIKKEIQNTDRGGKPGERSARKVLSTTAPPDALILPSKHLETWTKEEWQTKEGSGTARHDDDSRKQYLPKNAWEKLGEKEKEGMDEKKVEESQGGKQFVGNTAEAKEVRREASTDVGDEGEKAEENSEDIRRDGEADKKGTKRNKREKTEDKKKRQEERRCRKQTQS
ncbi:hypothetical protein N7501_012201 [Penicillium viridicatum]|nr:hypothetical protein N7501_012201 [Penicillium viridicatum]